MKPLVLRLIALAPILTACSSGGMDASPSPDSSAEATWGDEQRDARTDVSVEDAGEVVPLEAAAPEATADVGLDTFEDVLVDPRSDADRVNDAPPASERGPRILLLSTNVTTVRPSTPVTISAVVTDPDGIRDVIGGALSDPTSGATYGAFATSADEGAYSFTLSWSQIRAVAPVDGTPAGVRRTVRATFFDTGGNQTVRDLEVLVRCDKDNEAACDGACVDVSSSSAHCGACGTRAPAPRICRDGAFACPEKQTYCPGTNTCSVLDYDNRNCGACGVTVAGRCFDGKPNCNGGETVCPVETGFECRNLATDKYSCGTCGNVCRTSCGRGKCYSIVKATGRPASCQSLCASLGRTCHDFANRAFDIAENRWVGLWCGEAVSWGRTSSVECSCIE
jgi:hypothetical protein